MKPTTRRQRRAPALANLLLLALVLVLSACGGQPVEPTAVPGATAALPATPTETAPPGAPTSTTAPAQATSTAVPVTSTPSEMAPPATARPTGTAGAPLSTSTPAAQAAPEIVFVHNGNLAVIAADGSGLRTITDTGDVSQPRWSPDNTQIAFVRGKGSGARIYIGDAGGNFYNIPHAEGFGEADPRWSPDARTLAFVRAADKNGDGWLDENDDPQIWLVDDDGTNLRLLADGLDPSWAPDGRRIAFATTSDAGNTIDMINREGQNRWSPIKIAQIPQDTSIMNPDAQFNAGTIFLRYPEWSPGNQAIAFNAFGHSGLIVTASDKGANITPRDFSYEGGFRRVHWSPDGSRLVYEGQPPSGINQVHVLSLEGDKQTVFGDPHSGLSAESPTWAPDSLRIAFILNADPAAAATPGTGSLAVAPADGTGQPRILVEAGASEPDWR